MIRAKDRATVFEAGFWMAFMKGQRRMFCFIDFAGEWLLFFHNVVDEIRPADKAAFFGVCRLVPRTTAASLPSAFSVQTGSG